MHRLKREKRGKNDKKAGVISISVCVHKIDIGRTPKIISPQKSRPGK